MAADLFCTTCHAVGRPRTETRGSFWVEVFLWILFLIPGLLYSLWRLTTRRKVCPTCGAPTLVPLASPIARKLGARQPS